jgi:hypothetical protein
MPAFHFHLPNLLYEQCWELNLFDKGEYKSLTPKCPNPKLGKFTKLFRSPTGVGVGIRYFLLDSVPFLDQAS